MRLSWGCSYVVWFIWIVGVLICLFILFAIGYFWWLRALWVCYAWGGLVGFAIMFCLCLAFWVFAVVCICFNFCIWFITLLFKVGFCFSCFVNLLFFGLVFYRLVLCDLLLSFDLRCFLVDISTWVGCFDLIVFIFWNMIGGVLCYALV